MYVCKRDRERERESMFTLPWSLNFLGLGFMSPLISENSWLLSLQIFLLLRSLSSWILIMPILEHLTFSAVLQCSLLFSFSCHFQQFCYFLNHWKHLVIWAKEDCISSKKSVSFPLPPAMIRLCLHSLSHGTFRPFLSGGRLVFHRGKEMVAAVAISTERFAPFFETYTTK